MSEAESKALLAGYGVPFAAEAEVRTPDEAVDAATRIGFPVVVKLNGDRISHKTERGLVRLGLRNAEAVHDASTTLLAAARPDDGDVSLLVAQQVHGVRELIVGVVRDPHFGPVVMVGVGGVLAEAIGDVVFRMAPLSDLDAREMLEDLATQAVLGALRGEPAVDREALTDVLLALSRLAVERDDIESVDINPLIVCDGRPVAVDGLVERRERTVDAR